MRIVATFTGTKLLKVCGMLEYIDEKSFKTLRKSFPNKSLKVEK